jgi:hypothetical protein
MPFGMARKPLLLSSLRNQPTSQCGLVSVQPRSRYLELSVARSADFRPLPLKPFPTSEENRQLVSHNRQNRHRR